MRLPTVHNVRDLVLIDSHLTFRNHINSIVSRGHLRSMQIWRCFSCKNASILCKVFTTCAPPMLQHCIPVWSPVAVTLINQLESVQRRFTKRLPGFQTLPYDERCALLRLDRLELRRLRVDWILCYKIILGLVLLTADEFKYVYMYVHVYPSVLWRCWLGGRKGILPVKTEWWGVGVVICLEQGADLHMAQLMSLPLTVSCFSKIQIGFTSLVPAHSVVPEIGMLNGHWCVCVCVRACVRACVRVRFLVPIRRKSLLRWPRTAKGVKHIGLVSVRPLNSNWLTSIDAASVRIGASARRPT